MKQHISEPVVDGGTTSQYRRAGRRAARKACERVWPRGDLDPVTWGQAVDKAMKEAVAQMLAAGASQQMVDVWVEGFAYQCKRHQTSAEAFSGRLKAIMGAAGRGVGQNSRT